MSNPLFSTYSQGENRVTASILAVFERISFAIVEQILQSLVQEPETSLLTFRNQPSGPSSTPDARIRASFSYWIETKRVTNSVRGRQLKAHLKALDEESPMDTQRLLVLTPDHQIPGVVANTDDHRVVWASFEDLVTAVTEVIEIDEEWLASEFHIPTERERELLRELVRFLVSEGLVGQAVDEVLVVAARTALAEYLTHGIYVCQPNRTFRPCSHMAFYAGGRIHHQIPKVLDKVEQIMMTPEVARRYSDDIGRERLLSLLNDWEKENSPRIGELAKVMFLSLPNNEMTITLPGDIENDLVSESGRTIAFTQGQRYVSLEKLSKGPKTTSELLKR